MRLLLLLLLLRWCVCVDNDDVVPASGGIGVHVLGALTQRLTDGTFTLLISFSP